MLQIERGIKFLEKNIPRDKSILFFAGLGVAGMIIESYAAVDESLLQEDQIPQMVSSNPEQFNNYDNKEIGVVNQRLLVAGLSAMVSSFYGITACSVAYYLERETESENS